MSPLIALLIYLALLADFHFQPIGQGVYHRSSHAVQTAGDFISPAAEFAARMKDGKHHFHCRNTRLVVNACGNASAVVNNGDGIVFIDGYVNGITESGQSLVHGVIHNLVHQMVQTPAGSGTDIHTGPLPNRLKPFQNLDLISAVFLFNCRIIHGFFAHFYTPCPLQRT